MQKYIKQICLCPVRKVGLAVSVFSSAWGKRPELSKPFELMGIWGKSKSKLEVNVGLGDSIKG